MLEKVKRFLKKSERKSEKESEKSNPPCLAGSIYLANPKKFESGFFRLQDRQDFPFK